MCVVIYLSVCLYVVIYLFPVVFQPVLHKDEYTGQWDYYVDGGVLCNYPIHSFDGKLSVCVCNYPIHSFHGMWSVCV